MLLGIRIDEAIVAKLSKTILATKKLVVSFPYKWLECVAEFELVNDVLSVRLHVQFTAMQEVESHVLITYQKQCFFATIFKNFCYTCLHKAKNSSIQGVSKVTPDFIQLKSQ